MKHKIDIIEKLKENHKKQLSDLIDYQNKSLIGASKLYDFLQEHSDSIDILSTETIYSFDGVLSRCVYYNFNKCDAKFYPIECSDKIPGTDHNGSGFYVNFLENETNE